MIMGKNFVWGSNQPAVPIQAAMREELPGEGNLMLVLPATVRQFHPSLHDTTTKS